MYKVYQHWDPLKVCVVGRSYPPEFYSWIKVPHVRDLFQRIAIETEEDFQSIIKKLQEFNVEIMRPEIGSIVADQNKFEPPPMFPRDCTVMIGETFYCPNHWNLFYSKIKDPLWPDYDTVDDFLNHAESWQINEARTQHNLDREVCSHFDTRYRKILDHIRSKNNKIKFGFEHIVNGAMVSRIGRDLYFGTRDYDQNQPNLLDWVNREFPTTRNHVVNTGGHGDGTYCPVAPGLIISLRDVPTYAETFPGWEVIYLPNQGWHQVRPFLDLREKNKGKWWIPGFEYDNAVVEIVETWMSHWVGYVEETVFDVNMLIIDPRNVIVFNENEQVYRALDRYGITPHLVPFRHRYFWDGGIHCITADLDRRGEMQDFFPDRIK